MNGRIGVFPIDKRGSHIIVAVTSDGILRACTSQATDNSTLLGVSRLLQLLSLQMIVIQWLDRVAAANLRHLHLR